LLDALQASYFHFLDLKYKTRDEQYRREALKQDNLSEEQITEILDAHKVKRRSERKERTKIKNGNSVSANLRNQSAKVVYISFSWMLNDENMQRMLSINGNGIGEAAENTILGEEYTYTLILVSDNDPEKVYHN
jgi:hypothetical protein